MSFLCIYCSSQIIQILLYYMYKEKKKFMLVIVQLYIKIKWCLFLLGEFSCTRKHIVDTIMF